ncbi:SUMF1/EgtB/PvdO family nonheme iron enzyme [Acaryochloris marina NIES-2412]|uniref:SUMF1/EgtB/PvdO family nonheme iron enzyme n=1 Tax=Acaryochloris marina TaxID=155978 RepID=UPI004057E6A7
MIRKEGNRFYFLTSRHVIQDTNSGEEAYVVTSDGKQHSINTKSIRQSGTADLALAFFESSNDYTVGTFPGGPTVGELDDIYVAGYPLAGNATTESNFTITSGVVTSIGQYKDGYGIEYDARTRVGMSGGPVLNAKGELVGIHGRAEGESVGEVRVKSGFNLAIPINTAVSEFSLKISTSQQPSSAPEKTPGSEPLSRLNQFSFEVVRVNTRGQIVNRSSGSAKYFSEDFDGGVSLEMVAIPGGTFTMGSPSGELERDAYEGPQHKVTIPEFYLGKYPVTQAQWKFIMGSNPSKFKGDNRPVETVTWNDAINFCQKLSQRSGRVYRLPSEAEWEYACRAGTTTPFHFGETITTDLANYKGTDTTLVTGNYGSGPKGEDRSQTTQVGSFLPNAFGLYDMHGNVLEWCLDNIHPDYNGAPTDGSAWVNSSSKSRVQRGGSWNGGPRFCRSAYRIYNNIDVSFPYIGFRVAFSAIS